MSISTVAQTSRSDMLIGYGGGTTGQPSGTKARLSVSQTLETAVSRLGPTYTVPSLGISGLQADATINGVPAWKIAGAEQTTAGSVTVVQRTSLDVSLDTSNADGSTELDFHLEQESRVSTGDSGSSVAELVLEDMFHDKKTSDGDRGAAPARSYDILV